ncbi:MAG TPA: glycosyltransferase family 2 protein [Candidatus Moranbacteria bacterium]|nr:glycosyltransferase family 2 protein [Candidatus Moranbacteria bacterium]
MQNLKKISIVVVNFKSKKHLEKCLFSLEEKIRPCMPIEIIIVNNDEKENLDSFSLRENVIVVSPGKNLGFGAANNLGAKKASGEILLFLNPDTQVLSDNISKILEEFNNINLGALGPRLLDKNNKIQEWSAGKEMNFWRLILNNLGFKTGKKIWESEKKTKADWVAGTALFVRRNLFLSLGGFDEGFFMYFEDMDLCKRIRKAGKYILYHPHFSIWHLGGESYEDKKSQKKDYYVSQDYYFQKHYGKIQASLVKFMRIIFI